MEKLIKLIKYLELRNKFLSSYNNGLRNSRKYHPESWNISDEKELNSLNGRKKELESIIFILKEGTYDSHLMKINLKIKAIKDHRKKND